MGGTSLYGSAFLLRNFPEFSRNWRIYHKNTRYKFFAIISLHCHNQVTKIVKLIFRLFCLLQKCLLWIEMLMLLVKIVELQ